MRCLDAHLFATHDQLEAIFFTHGTTKTGKPRALAGAPYAANHALQQLWHSGYVDRIWLTIPNSPYQTPVSSMRFKQHFVNVLTPAGSRVVIESAIADPEAARPRWKRSLLPNSYTGIDPHDYEINRFLLAALSACAPEIWDISNVLDDRQLKLLHEDGFRFGAIPDGFFVIANREREHLFTHFVEIDLGTEVIPVIEAKIRAYGSYITTLYDEKFDGLPRPVVLIVTPSAKRRDNILHAIHAAGGGGSYWVTTFVELSQTGFWGRCWRVWSEAEPRALLDRCLA